MDQSTLNAHENGTGTLEPAYHHHEHGFFSEVLRFTVIALLIVLPIRLFIAQPFIVSGSSMDPTFGDGQYLIVDELTYHFEKPTRGDVIVFRYPKDTSKYFIKRVVGLPNETVAIENGIITIYNDAHPEGLPVAEPYVVNKSSDNFRIALKAKEYFVMGDNRPASSDSRSWGTLPENLIVGRAFIRLLPVDHIGILPGAYSML